MTDFAPESVWVVIPAYQESTVIGPVVAAVAALGYRTAVVDDGSRDDTGAAAAAAGAAVVKHPINLGQGAALQTGVEFALQRGASFIVTFDADGQHQPEDLLALLRPLMEGEADFALGSRFLGGTVGASRSRLLLLRAATAFTRMMTGLALTDAHNGLRAFTRRGAMALNLHQNRMAHASEILDQIAQSGLRYVEVPVNIHYTEYSRMKGQKMSDAINILIDIFARRLLR